MSAGGKGHARRPTNETAYADGFDRIFGRKADQALADSMRAENLASALGSGVTGSAADSNSAGSGSSPDSPAIYIGNASG